jgi:carbamate kinase
VIADYGTPRATPIHHTTPAALRSQHFPAGSMGPKVDAACRFVELTGNTAAIGALDTPAAMLRGDIGTVITPHGKVERSTS